MKRGPFLVPHVPRKRKTPQGPSQGLTQGEKEDEKERVKEEIQRNEKQEGQEEEGQEPRCTHPVKAMRREGDGSIVCGECGSVVEGAARTEFFQHCAAHAVAPQPAFVAPGECTGNTYVGADGRARPHFPRGASSAVRKLIATPSARESSARHAEADVRKLAARHALPSAVTADVLDAMRRVLDARVWTRGAYGERVAAAVVYYVCRQHRQPLTLEEVAAAQGCSPALMKRVCKRVLPVLDGSLSLLDPSSWLKRAVHLMVANSSSTNTPGGTTPTTGHEAEEANVLGIAQKLYSRVVVPNSFGTGRKPLPVVAAVVALALEIVRGCEAHTLIDAAVHVLGARKKTVTARYDELLQYLLGCARKINFGKKVTTKTLPQFGPIILRVWFFFPSSSSSFSRLHLKTQYLEETNSNPQSETTEAQTSEPQAATTAATTKLPQSFVKVEKERERRRKLVADCKRMHAAMTQGLPFPADIDISPEMCEVQKLLLEGVPEDMIINNDAQMLLKNTDSMCLAVPPKAGTPNGHSDKDDEDQQLGPELDDSELNSYLRDRSEVSILGKMREVTERDPSKSELLAAERKKQRVQNASGRGETDAVSPQQPLSQGRRAPRAGGASQQRPSQRPIKASTRIDRERLAKLVADVRPAEPLDGIM